MLRRIGGLLALHRARPLIPSAVSGYLNCRGATPYWRAWQARRNAKPPARASRLVCSRFAPSARLSSHGYLSLSRLTRSRLCASTMSIAAVAPSSRLDALPDEIKTLIARQCQLQDEEWRQRKGAMVHAPPPSGQLTWSRFVRTVPESSIRSLFAVSRGWSRLVAPMAYEASHRFPAVAA